MSLPAWVLEVGTDNPDIFFADQIHDHSLDCLSIGIDEGVLLPYPVQGEIHIFQMRSPPAVLAGAQTIVSRESSAENCDQCYGRVTYSYVQGFHRTGSTCWSQLSGCAVPLLRGRTALDCYFDFMNSFHHQFEHLYADVIHEVTIGMASVLVL